MSDFIILSILEKYVGNKAEVIIPDGVIKIGPNAFKDCSFIASVTIPEGVTEIGEGAFKNCTALTNVKISNSVTTISKDAFRGCTSLASIEIPSGVITIGKGAFSGCTSLASIEIPSGVITIGEGTFSGCTSLASIEILSGVTSIGRSAFYNCKSLTSIEIPSGVTSIEKYAFLNCTSLESVTIPSSVTSIGDNTFENCTSLASIEIPSSVTSIGNNTFEYCTSLTSIEIPNNVSKIGGCAFSGCVSLTKVVMPKKLPQLEKGAFFDCVLIENIEDIIQSENNLDFWKMIFGENATILLAISNDAPSDVVDFSSKHKKTCIDLMVKYNRINLISRLLEKSPQIKIGELDELIEHARQYNSVEINAALLEYKNKNYSKENVEQHENDKLDKLLGLKPLSVEEWKKIFNIKTEKGEVIIKKYLGSDDCVVIPEMIGKSKVTVIDEKAFFDCSMTSVVIPNTVKKIGNRAFANCTSLTSIFIPNTVTEIAVHAFSSCSALEIQCEATEEPENWWHNWNPDNRPVEWGCKKQ